MPQQAPDLAALRFQNALALFDEFVRATAVHADAATLRGLERRFAERIEIQPSYWSQIKGRSRQIGERLARQFEQRCGKPGGWMDQSHDPAVGIGQIRALGDEGTPDPATPRDDDERFILSLVLSYYRRDPRRARTRLLDLLGEVLMSPEAKVVQPPPTSIKPTPPATTPPVAAAKSIRPTAALGSPPDDDLWHKMQQGIAPLKRKR